MVLTRGLSLEHQKSSRDSLQYSSGYSTQTTTPSCSEDTIPSQGGPGGRDATGWVCLLGLHSPGTRPTTAAGRRAITKRLTSLSVSLE